MNENQQASALAAWLTSGGEPPDGVDGDVLEAIYALRPDLAPAPRLSVDDILGDIQEGPLAERLPDNVLPFRRSDRGIVEVEVEVDDDDTAPEVVVEFEDTAPEVEVVVEATDPEVAPPPPIIQTDRNVIPLRPIAAPRPHLEPELLTPEADAPAPRSRWWMGGAAGLLAAAAAVLLVVQPASSPEPQASKATADAATAPAAPAAAPLPEKAEEPLVAAAPLARPAPPQAELPAAEVAAATGGLPAEPDATSGAAELDGDAVADAPAPDELQKMVAPASTAPADAIVAADEAREEEERSQIAEVVESPKAEPTIASGALGGASAAPAPYPGNADLAEDDVSTKLAAAEKKPAGRAKAADAPAAANTASGETVNTGPAESASEIDIARELAAQGNLLGAARRTEALIKAPAATGQQAALEGARWALQANDRALATRLAEKGLKLAPTGKLADALRSVLEQAKGR